ncbi:MAG: hypothetical protein JW737_02555 [Acidobacteria bacterium]|nr:hypothetical protein [Acidobacteriota bacterium]
MPSKFQPVYRDSIDKLERLLEKTGFTTDPIIFPQLKNTHFYHKFRKKLYSAHLLDTVAGISDVFDKINGKYKLLYSGFWSVFPVLFAVETYDNIKDNFRDLIIKYNRDIFELRPYTAKCTFHITIWPKVEIQSHPNGILLILSEADISEESIAEHKKIWNKLDGYDKFGVMPPLFANIKTGKVISPFTRTRLNKYPPSISSIEEALTK